MSNSNDSTCGAGGNTGKSGGKWRVTVVKSPGQTNSGPAQVVSYQQQLAVILRERNVFRFRNFLAANGRALPDDMMLDTLKMANVMHQLILSLPELADLHDFSRQWMRENSLLAPGESLTEAAKRLPGEPAIPPPAPGRRSISLKTIPLTGKPSQN